MNRDNINELNKRFEKWTTSELAIRLSLLKRMYKVLSENKRVSWTESEACQRERIWLKHEIKKTKDAIQNRQLELL